jgi:hypothetical protein
MRAAQYLGALSAPALRAAVAWAVVVEGCSQLPPAGGDEAPGVLERAAEVLEVAAQIALDELHPIPSPRDLTADRALSDAATAAAQLAARFAETAHLAAAGPAAGFGESPPRTRELPLGRSLNAAWFLTSPLSPAPSRSTRRGRPPPAAASRPSPGSARRARACARGPISPRSWRPW